MPRRTLIWPPTDQSTNREGEVVVCAEHWLIDHTKVFNDGKGTRDENNIVLRFAYAYVGPRLCTPNPIEDNDGHPQSDDSYCHYSGPFYSDPCGPGGLKYCLLGHPEIWFPVGETEGGDNTRDIIRDGGLKTAQALHRQLGLAPIVALASPKARLGTLAVENRP